MEMAGLIWLWEPVANTSRLQRLWTELEGRSSCSFFLTWDWIGTWLSETPDVSPILLSVYDGATVVALALFQPTTFRRYLGQIRALMLNRSGDPSTDLITMEYNQILTDRRYTHRVEAELFSFLIKSGILGSGENCREELHVALATNSLADQAREAGLITRELVRMPSWFVDLNNLRASGNGYLDILGANTRHQIRRSMRIYEQRGTIKLTAASSANEASEFLDELKHLHQKSWNGRGLPGSFANAHFQRFHHTLVSRCVERGSAEILRITAGDYLIGLVYNFIRNAHVYAYQTGLSYENEPKLKPGLTCHTKCIERHLGEGASVYDFMGGNARYKASLGIRGPDLAYYVIERKTLRSQSLSWARHLRDRLNHQ